MTNYYQIIRKSLEKTMYRNIIPIFMGTLTAILLHWYIHPRQLELNLNIIDILIKLPILIFSLISIICCIEVILTNKLDKTPDILRSYLLGIAITFAGITVGSFGDFINYYIERVPQPTPEYFWLHVNPIIYFSLYRSLALTAVFTVMERLVAMLEKNLQEILTNYAQTIKRNSIERKLNRIESVVGKTNARKGLIRVSIFATFGSWIIAWIIGLFVPNIQLLVYNNSYGILGTIVQGMSALLGIAIAVVIFRIQGLNSHIQILEQNTIDYVYRLNRWVYTTWNDNLIESIKSGAIAKRYLENRLAIKELVEKYGKEELVKDAENQQIGLLDNLNKHDKIEEIIKRVKRDFKFTTIFLLAPITASLLNMMFPVCYTEFLNYMIISYTLISYITLFCIMGVFILIILVLDSTE